MTIAFALFFVILVLVQDHPDVTRMKDSLTREVEGITEMAVSRNMQRYKHTLAAFVDRVTACTDARIAAEQRFTVFLSCKEIN